jgi:hypothetical protein
LLSFSFSLVFGGLAPKVILSVMGCSFVPADVQKWFQNLISPLSEAGFRI